MLRHRLTSLLMMAAILSACSGDNSPTAASSGSAPRPLAGISDGAHAGNPDFFFMPPMMKNPSAHPDFDAGGFNANLSPRVSICLLAVNGTTCESTIKEFAPAEIAVSPSEGLYHVNWNTSSPALLTTRYYRIRVFVGSTEVGFADVDPVSNSSQLRNVQTNEYIGLVDGRTLPIKFRIEKGALCANSDCAEQTVTNAGAIVLTNTGYAGADFPQGWIPANITGPVTVKIERVPVGPNNNCHANADIIQYEGCYYYSTDPVIPQFAKPVTVGVCPELDHNDPRFHSLVIVKSDVDEPLNELPAADAPFLDCEGFTGTPILASSTMGSRVRDGLFAFAGGVGRFLGPKPLYAVDLGIGALAEDFSFISFALPTNLQIISGNGQTAAPGATLPLNPTVLVTGGHGGAPLPNVKVYFSVINGGGSVASSSVLTGADGKASVPWTIGTGGVQTLQVKVAGSAAQSFTATVNVAPDLHITSPFTVTPSLVVRNGLPMPVTLSGYTITNSGGDLTSGISNGFYLSTDAVLTPNDHYFSGNNNSAGVLQAGESFQWGGPTFGIPASTPQGKYWVGVLVDNQNNAAESNEANNFASAPVVVMNQVIDFEIDAAGNTCSNCAVTNEWAARGVTFSYTSQFSSLTNVQVQQGPNNPQGDASNHILTAPQIPNGGGYPSGVLRMTFSGAPDTVEFHSTVNDMIGTYDVLAYDAAGNVVMTGYFTSPTVYQSGNVAYRRNTVRVWNNSGAGIARVEVHMNGFIALIDNLRLIGQ